MMNKITKKLYLFVFLALLGYGQVKAQTTICLNDDNTIEATSTTGTTPACNGNGDTSNWARFFEFDDSVCGIGSFDITSVDMGVETAGLGNVITLSIYTVAGNYDPSVSVPAPNIPLADLTLIAQTNYTFTSEVLLGSGVVIEVPITASIPPGTDYLIEVTALNVVAFDMVLGSNTNGQSAPSYFRSDDCGGGVSDYQDLETFGFGDVSYVLCAKGDNVLLTGGDVATIDIMTEVCSPKYTEVIATIRNNSATDVSNIPLAFVLDGGEPVIETFTGTIGPCMEVQYRFGARIDLSDNAIHILDVYTSFTGDALPINDAIIGTQVSAISGLPGIAPPISQDFEGLTAIPTGWLQETNASDGGWNVGDGSSGGFAIPIPASGVDYIYTNDDACNCDKSNDLLILPLNLEKFVNTSLSFDMYYEDNSFIFFGIPFWDEDLTLEISTDNGASWETLENFSAVADWTNRSFDLSAYDGLPNLQVGFRYNDLGTGAFGAALDNISVTGDVLLDGNVTLTTPLVEESYVAQGTPHHIIYQAAIENQNGTFSLDNIVFKTNGSYRPSDINIQGDTLGFRLWVSDDSILGPGDDPLLGVVTALPSGSLLPFTCLSYPFTNIDETFYVFLTVDIATNAVDNRTIWVDALTINDVATKIGNITVSNAINSQRQIIGVAPTQAPSDIFMPDVFTPNGDGNNDTYTIVGGAINEVGFSFKIFDRNGTVVYETNDVNEASNIGWDGKTDGEDVPNGAYIWSLEGSYLNGGKLTYRDMTTGVVRLLR